jgi:hypothetical protein
LFRNICRKTTLHPVYFLQHILLASFPMLVRRWSPPADMFCPKPADVATEDRRVSTAAPYHRLVVAPIIGRAEPAMDHHVAGKAQVELIGFAGSKWLAVVFGMCFDDTFILCASDTLHRTHKHARPPLAI